MINLLAVFLGGGLGALLRYGCCLRISGHLGVFIVNVLGALLIGVAFHFFAVKTELRPELRSFIITGLLGGFTTFSTYILDFGLLLDNKNWNEAFLYLIGSIVVGYLFLILGVRIGKLFF